MSLQQVATRRAVLLQRIAQQRTELAMLAQSLQRPASIFDKGYTLAQKIKQHPKLVSGIALLSMMFFRKHVPIVKLAASALTAVKWWLALKKHTSQVKPTPARLTSEKIADSVLPPSTSAFL